MKMAPEGAVSDEENLPSTLTPKDMRYSQDNSSVSPSLPWGRLVTCKNFLKNVDLIQKFSFGRGESCSVLVNNKNCPYDKVINGISKIHFEIQKSDEDQLVFITDCSKNGTYVNGKKLGYHNKKILKNKDHIAVSNSSYNIYIYLSHNVQEADEFLPVELANRFASITQLGRGSCGEVRLVKDRDTFRKYAVKKIVLTESASELVNKLNHPTKVRNEIEILSRLQHPCVIAMYDYINIERSVYLILEYMEGGELTQRIRDAPMREDVVKFYFYQMIAATQYLHSQNIIHRDLKPENILLRDRREETLLKITDFGLSKITEQSVATTMCGTMRYVAPEVISASLRDSGEYGDMVDVWSLGVILYFMTSQEVPFNGFDNQTIARQILSGKYNLTDGIWSDRDKIFVKDLVRRMLQLRPAERIRINHVFRHDWIKHDHGMKLRVRRLLKEEGLPIMAMEPPSPKRFKFTDSSSDESTLSETLSNITTENYSCSSTICCN
ncbi:ovarian-specific serine/threonine-protein kinase Lok-like isoform X2 [Euwallacea fornicatus]|uniref:ovarian-specific serine/threonine-protein kinase Lok-like isoform X2 n=1 Tax=Euwallacea fornicatus TaxID=995702 RepID=UPI00338DC619